MSRTFWTACVAGALSCAGCTSPHDNVVKPQGSLHLESYWEGIGGDPAPTAEEVADQLPGGFLLMASTDRATEVLAMNRQGFPIGKLVVPDVESRGLAWHSSGAVALGGLERFWRLDLDGTSLPMGVPHPISFRPHEGADGQLWLAEEDTPRSYDPEVPWQGQTSSEAPSGEEPPTESPPTGEPDPCFMDVTNDGDGIVSLEIITGRVFDQEGRVVADGLPEPVESLTSWDDSLWVASPFDEEIWRVDGDVSVHTTMSELGWPDYVVWSLEGGADGLTVLGVKPGPPGEEWRAEFVVLQLTETGSQVRSAGSGGWLDIALVP